MSTLPPAWAMGAVGLHSMGDPHLADGVHLRVLLSPKVGLPVCPMLVYRLTEHQMGGGLGSKARTAFAWQDDRGQVRTLPTRLEAGQTLGGRILRGVGERALAVVVHAAPEAQHRTHASPEVGRTPDPSKGSRLVMEAFIDTPQGRRVIGRRTEAPYAIAAPQIDGVILRGAGMVRLAMWIPAFLDGLQRQEPLFLLDLPVPGGSRYIGLPDAQTRAMKRVRRGAPQRLGLHDEPDAGSPALASPATQDEEWKRVKVLARELDPYLDQVLNDPSDKPTRLGRDRVLDEGVRDSARGTARVSSIGTLLTGAADPGLARWLGLMDMDPDPPDSGLALYFIRAVLPVDAGNQDLGEVFGLLAAADARLTSPVAVPGLPEPVPATSADGLPVFDFVQPVLVMVGAATERPDPPTVGVPLKPTELLGATGTQALPTGDALGTWLADAVPPDAVREIVLPLSGLEAAPILAVARQEPTRLVGLNERHPTSGRALALVPAVVENAGTTGVGRFADRTAPPEAVVYRVAQADWWGRWSGWATRTVDAKPRTPPPAPIFTLDYQPAPVEPLNDAPRFGRLWVQVVVPRPEDLAAGSRALRSVLVSGTVGGVPVSVTEPVSSARDRKLVVTIPGPAGMIGRSGRVTARLNARWFDGTESGPLGEEQKRDLIDLRPPPALVLDPALRYSARPDATGRSQVVLSWTGQAGRQYRVYHSDETRLLDIMKERSKAGDAAAAALVQALSAAPDAAYRAQAWTNAPAGLFTRELFTNLTATPLAGSDLRFAHDLSGSLKVLAFFKVVALSEDSVESPFTDATLLPVAVPSGGPPPRPLLDFRRFDESGAAVLAVTVVRGPQPAGRWRLRRSAAASEDPLRMPVVAEGAIPDADPGAEGPQVFELLDPGADAFAGGSLPPWTRLSWRIEVQAKSPPGTSRPGEWSPASGAVGSLRMPEAPAAPTDLGLVGDELRWRHPEPLRRGAMGGYRFEIYRRLPGGREERVNDGPVLADDPGVQQVSGSTRTFRFSDPGPAGAPAPAGTTWRVLCVDPAGRMSPPSSPVQRS